jgi:methionyl-tRNA formyltransferase
VLEAFKYGAINIHPSKLPRWRGAAPIQRTIMAGDRETGVCIMQMDEGLDTGDVLTEETLAISEVITAGELTSLLAEVGAVQLRNVVDMIEAGIITHTKQSADEVTYANKITRDEEVINWNQSARMVNCQIRALSPRPGAYFKFNNELIKVIAAEYDINTTEGTPGIVLDDKLTIACSEGVIVPKLLQRQGRKMLYTDAFLRGFLIPKGSKLD